MATETTSNIKLTHERAKASGKVYTAGGDGYDFIQTDMGWVEIPVDVDTGMAFYDSAKVVRDERLIAHLDNKAEKHAFITLDSHNAKFRCGDAMGATPYAVNGKDAALAEVVNQCIALGAKTVEFRTEGE